MKVCPNCGNQAEDHVKFCPACGSSFGEMYQGPVVPPYDHTAEFDPRDVSDNKVFAMLVYLMGIVGVIVALLASRDSRYAAFHVRQALKFTVVEVLLGIVVLVLCWTFIIPILGGIAYVALFVAKIIAFIQICQGRALEPVFIRNIDFLK